MSSRPWYKWYPGDYLADTYHLSWDADLLYRRILDALWEHGTLPTDLGDLSKICRIDPRKIRRIFPEVLPYLSEISGRYHHPKISRQRVEAIERKGKASKAGKKGGEATAAATRARARAHVRTRPDPDPDINRSSPSALPAQDSPARAREATSGAEARAAFIDPEREKAAKLKVDRLMGYPSPGEGSALTDRQREADSKARNRDLLPRAAPLELDRTPCADGPLLSNSGAVVCCVAHLQNDLERRREAEGVEPQAPLVVASRIAAGATWTRPVAEEVER